MNRTQRRQQERQKSNTEKTYNLTQKQINDMIYNEMKEFSKKIIAQHTDLFVAAIKQVMMDKFGFGKIRLDRMMQELNKTIECIRDGYVSIEDLKQLDKGA